MGWEGKSGFCLMAALLFLLCFCSFSFFGEWAGDTTMRGSGAWEVLSCSAIFELASVCLGRPTARISTS